MSCAKAAYDVGTATLFLKKKSRLSNKTFLWPAIDLQELCRKLIAVRFRILLAVGVSRMSGPGPRANLPSGVSHEEFFVVALRTDNVSVGPVDHDDRQQLVLREFSKRRLVRYVIRLQAKEQGFDFYPELLLLHLLRLLLVVEVEVSTSAR
jgi:hypothetical protein